MNADVTVNAKAAVNAEAAPNAEAAVNDRYSRQILFQNIGEEGQRKLLAARVLIVGCGALGTAHAEALCRAGTGHLRIVDRDFVEPSNLQRQTLFTEADAETALVENMNGLKKLCAEHPELLGAK